MYLSSVKIKNFRSLRNVQFSLQPGLSVIVGRNNSGKTSLLDGIRLAVSGASTKTSPIWLSKDDFYREEPDSVPVNELSVSLGFEGLDHNEESLFFEIIDPQRPDKVAELHYEARLMPNGTTQQKRWGGRFDSDRNPVPPKILDSLPLTFLPALRDATRYLRPGNHNLLASVLTDMFRGEDEKKTGIVEFFKHANEKLLNTDLVSQTQSSLIGEVKEMAGSDFAKFSISANQVSFEGILRSLQILVDANPIPDLASNGLGYNNLLYTGTTLQRMRESQDSSLSILLIEEPEAHLHPQLTVLLGEYLQNPKHRKTNIQMLATTHSPSFVANLKPSSLLTMFSGKRGPTCTSLSSVGLSAREERELQRMLDVTKSTLFFAKGVILVEGISESLLVPELAMALTHKVDLKANHVSVIPICGVSFKTFEKLFGPHALDIPVAIVSDSDPPVKKKENGEEIAWSQLLPEKEKDGSFKTSDRAKALEKLFASSTNVSVHLSEVTLEYDLAIAGDDNCSIMAECWAECFDGTPRTFTQAIAKRAQDSEAKGLAAWRGICMSKTKGSKGEFAQQLADYLGQKRAKQLKDDDREFLVPGYLERAIRAVVPSQEREKSGSD